MPKRPQLPEGKHIPHHGSVSLTKTYLSNRLMKEYRDLTADPLQETITAGPVSEDNMLEWEALIQGPEDTPYVSFLATPMTSSLLDQLED